MIIRSELLLDKSDWLPGPWVDEPDIVEWVDEGTRLPCLILRAPNLGYLRGYVGVPPGHLAWGMHYNDLHQVKVHAGLDFNGPINHALDTHADYWVFGFYCAHILDKYDFANPHGEIPRLAGREYRDVEYCMDQCRRLASQLIGLDP